MQQAINSLAEELLAIYLNKGVQIGDLASNIFDIEYETFTVNKRKDGCVLVQLSFKEELDDHEQAVSMRYTYTQISQLILIEQKVGSSRYKIQWCRNTAISDAVRKLVLRLKGFGYTSDMIEGAIASLPDDLAPRVLMAVKAAA